MRGLVLGDKHGLLGMSPRLVFHANGTRDLPLRCYAALPGGRLELVGSATFVAAGVLSGVAGLLYLYTFGLDYSLGTDLTLAGFGAAIIFGIHSPSRAFFGGLAIGVVEALSTAYAPPEL